MGKSSAATIGAWPSSRRCAAGGARLTPFSMPSTCSTRRHRSAPGANRGAQGHAGQHPAQEPAGCPGLRTSGPPRRRTGVRSRLQARRRRDRVQAAGVALQFGPVAGLAQVQEPAGAGSEAEEEWRMPHPEWSAMSSEQKMEFLYNWCFQMSEVVQELRATTQRSWTRSF